VPLAAQPVLLVARRMLGAADVELHACTASITMKATTKRRPPLMFVSPEI
jgi:hypothetical protein